MFSLRIGLLIFILAFKSLSAQATPVVTEMKENEEFEQSPTDPNQVLSQIQDLAALSELEEGKIIELDRDTVRYVLASYIPASGMWWEKVLFELKKIYLVRNGDRLVVTADFNRAFAINVKEGRKFPSGTLYKVAFPKQARFTIRASDEALLIEGLSQNKDGVGPISLFLKIPAFTDRVIVDRVYIDLTTGGVHAHLWLLNKALAVIGKARLYEKMFDGVDFWESIKRNVNRVGCWLKLGRCRRDLLNSPQIQ
jgi:hypothetical protein